jgi:hypothetical protein
MPTFKSSPDVDSAARGPYDDLNRLDRNGDRNNDGGNDRNGDRNPERNQARQRDGGDERNAADLRAQDRLDRNGREIERNPDQRGERNADREPEHVQAKALQTSRKSTESADPLIQGLFSKLPEPSAEWPLPARQKWLQTAANIFDLMYASGEADAGELTIRVERNTAR